MQSGQKQTRTIGFYDKLLILTRPDGKRIGFDYYPDGMLAAKAPLPGNANPATGDSPQSSKSGEKRQTVGSYISSFFSGTSAEEGFDANPDQSALNQNLKEEFVRDGLALLYKNGITYTIEPHASGGITLVSRSKDNSSPVYYINDILGTTLAVVCGEQVKTTPLSAFGNPAALRQNQEQAPISSADEAFINGTAPSPSVKPEKIPSGLLR